MRIVFRTAAKQAVLSGCGMLALCSAGTIARADQPIQRLKETSRAATRPR